MERGIREKGEEKEEKSGDGEIETRGCGRWEKKKRLVSRGRRRGGGGSRSIGRKGEWGE